MPLITTCKQNMLLQKYIPIPPWVTLGTHGFDPVVLG